MATAHGLTLLASTEPRSFERGDDAADAIDVELRLASTEPRSFERGDHGSRARCAKTPRRFNGAALFRARRCTRGRAHRARCRHFNGAALFRARRYGAVRESAPDDPRFNGAALFRARRWRCGGSERCRWTTLQRSRALSSAEMRIRGRWTRRSRRFNGAALFRARRSEVAIREQRAWELLQRSRALSSAEMGATTRWAATWDWLQRSRALSSAEMALVRFCAFCITRFNGAALFRARR